MNLSTFIVFSIIVLIVFNAMRIMISDKKNGKSSCGGNCGACGSESLCHRRASFIDEYKSNQ